jgi:polysaccharide biosynthesis transport protein
LSAPLADAGAALELPVQSIWTALAGLRTDEETPLRVLFASPRHGDGTTTLAACTALSLCRNLRTRVALVEANPFTPALAAYAGCAPAPGFADVLRNGPGQRDGNGGALSASFEPGLSLMPGGTLAATEPVDWRGPSVRELLDEELASFPFALLDAPPLLDRPAGRLLLASADFAVLVVRAGVTSKADARAAQQILEASDVPLAGVVLNRFETSWPFR